MTSRAAPSGIALEIRRKLQASYDIDGELNARLWIEDVTGILMDDPPPEVESLEQLNEWRINHRELGSKQFARVLKDGIFLCKLINTLEPGTIKKIHEENLSRFKMTENIYNFLKAAKSWGCTEQDLFQSDDLYEERNMNQVLNGIYAVARKVQDRIQDDRFPTLGPKEAKYNPRNFTDEQLARGKGKLEFIDLIRRHTQTVKTVNQQHSTENHAFTPDVPIFLTCRLLHQMTGLVLFISFSLLTFCNGKKNVSDLYVRRLTDPRLNANKRTLSSGACTAPEIENSAPIRVENLPARSGTWTYPIYCKPGYSLIGPCRLVCRETSGGTFAFSPPYGLETPSCVKDYAASQFRCNYLSSVCPLVWDNVPEPTQPPIAISRIFCGQITKATPSNLQVYGFGSSMYASETGGNLCLYKGGIKDIPCYTVKGQRMVAVGKGNDLPAITYLGNLDGYEALSGSEDPYIGKLSRQYPHYLFPPDLSPSSLVSTLREYLATCVKRQGQVLLQCAEIYLVTSSNNGYDIMIGGRPVVNGIADAFPVPPGKKCQGQRCCCDVNST